jgi:hypothetical protein
LLKSYPSGTATTKIKKKGSSLIYLFSKTKQEEKRGNRSRISPVVFNLHGAPKLSMPNLSLSQTLANLKKYGRKRRK